MIAHVAQADEQRGRVVLWLGGAEEPHETALDAAFKLAAAFQAEVDSLFIEDGQLFDLADLPFAREIALSGRQTRQITGDALARDIRANASAQQRRVLARARAADIVAHARVLRSDPVGALARACTENGPWNVVTVGTAVRSGEGARLAGAGFAALLDTVQATTGVVVAGPRARRTAGPVIAVIEEIERLAPMLRAAERISRTTGGDARIWLLDHDQGRLEWIEGQIRLALGAHPAVKLEVIDMSRATAWDVAAMMRSEGAGFVIARFGGQLAPTDDDAALLAEMLEGPLFLVR